jgi:hypothetical protein
MSTSASILNEMTGAAAIRRPLIFSLCASATRRLQQTRILTQIPRKCPIPVVRVRFLAIVAEVSHSARISATIFAVGRNLALQKAIL